MKPKAAVVASDFASENRATDDEIVALRDQAQRWGFAPRVERAGVDANAIASLVNDAADSYERFTSARVSPEARGVLIDRGVQHLGEISGVLARGTLVPSDLGNAAFQQLRQASDGADGSTVTTGDIWRSLREKCWFVGWC